MSNPKKLLLAVAAAFFLCTASSESDAAGLFRRAPVSTFMLTSVATTSGNVGGITPDCCVPEPRACCQSACYRPCVRYVDRSCCRSCDPCNPPVKQTLTYCDPCTGCKMAINVCIPACCTGCPQVSERCTIIGCGAVTYQWCCGFSATLRFARSGDVTVIYRG
ncbi:MAG: hypothetical protein KF708_10580 [Pirellulales bacterium]|nr:hypothetical protein [Pirellulales bacterium]